MIGLDTNIVLRLITEDDEAQARIVRRILAQRVSAADPGYISIAVVLETAWVLQSVYAFSDADTAAALRAIVAVPELMVEAEQEVLVAVVALEESGAPFADTLIAALARAAGCTTTITFDRAAARLPGFELAR